MPDSAPTRALLLSRTLKAVRRHRGLRPPEVAAAMGMPLRSYEHFEAGLGRFNLERVHQFAEALDADAFAILAAIDIGSPEFAVRCADNKFMTILTMAVQDFDAQAGVDIPRLDARSLIAMFTRLFDEVEAKAREDDAFVERWMSDKVLLGPGPSEDESD